MFLGYLLRCFASLLYQDLHHQIQTAPLNGVTKIVCGYYDDSPGKNESGNDEFSFCRSFAANCHIHSALRYYAVVLLGRLDESGLQEGACWERTGYVTQRCRQIANSKMNGYALLYSDRKKSIVVTLLAVEKGKTQIDITVTAHPAGGPVD